MTKSRFADKQYGKLVNKIEQIFEKYLINDARSGKLYAQTLRFGLRSRLSLGMFQC